MDREQRPNSAIIVSSDINKQGNSKAEKTQNCDIKSYFCRILVQGIENNENIFEHAVPELLDRLNVFSTFNEWDQSLISIQILSLNDKENPQNKAMWVDLPIICVCFIWC